MSTYATLDEVWGTDFSKKKSKKRKSKPKSEQKKYLKYQPTENKPHDLETNYNELESYYNQNGDISSDNLEGFDNFTKPYSYDNLDPQSVNEDSDITGFEDNTYENIENIENIGNLTNNEGSTDPIGSIIDKQENDSNIVSEEMDDDIQNKFMEIDEKLNLIIDRLNSNVMEDSEKNINDIILFIVFGIFFIIVIDTMFKFALKLNHSSSL
jgi:hypothetical protein